MQKLSRWADRLLGLSVVCIVMLAPYGFVRLANGGDATPVETTIIGEDEEDAGIHGADVNARLAGTSAADSIFWVCISLTDGGLLCVTAEDYSKVLRSRMGNERTDL